MSPRPRQGCLGGPFRVCDVLAGDNLLSLRNGADCSSLIASREPRVGTSLSPTRPSLRYGDFMHLSALLASDPGVHPPTSSSSLGSPDNPPPAPAPDPFSLGIHCSQPLKPFTFGTQEFRPPAPPPQGTCGLAYSPCSPKTTVQLSCDLQPLFFYLRNGLTLETRARASGTWWALCDPSSCR